MSYLDVRQAVHCVGEDLTRRQPFPPVFPCPGAAVDLDFVNRRYWWNGAARGETEFTTSTIGNGSFGPNGLTPGSTTDWTVSTAALGAAFLSGSAACAVYNGASIPVTECSWWVLDDNTASNQVRVAQNGPSAASLAAKTLVGAVVQGNTSSGTKNSAINKRHGHAWSWNTNDFKAAANGFGLIPDTIGTLAASLLTLRIGKHVGGSNPIGALSRLILFTGQKTQVELQDLSAALQVYPGSLPAFPLNNAAVDLDFVGRRYFWAGKTHGTADFTTFALSGATFGPNGLTPTDTMDVTLALGGLGTFIPGAWAAAAVQTGAPASAGVAFSLDDGTIAERTYLQHNTTPRLGGIIVDGSVTQANIGGGVGTEPLNTRHGFAMSLATDDVKGSANGVAGTADVVATMPTVTTLRIGKSPAAASQFVGAVARVALYTVVKTQAELDALSAQMRTPASPVPWTPLDLGAALKAWWSADDHGTARMVDDGAGLISSWTDRVGGMAITATTTARPTWAAASFNSAYAGLTFDGVANCFVSTVLTTLPTGATAGEIWSAVKNSTLPADINVKAILGYGTSAAASDRIVYRDVSAGVNKLRVGDQLGAGVLYNIGDFSFPAIAQGFWSGTTQGANLNGGTASTGAITSLNTATVRLRMGASLGTTPGVNQFFNGVVRHAFVTTTLSASDRQKMEGWLAWDANMQSQLPAGHPYKAARP